MGLIVPRQFLPGQLAQGITFFLKHKIQQKGSSSFNPKKGGSNEEGKRERKEQVCLIIIVWRWRISERAPQFNFSTCNRERLASSHTTLWVDSSYALSHGMCISQDCCITCLADFSFLGSKVTVDGDCSHEIKRYLLLGRKVMTNLNSVFKSRDNTLLTKVHLVKAMVFPVVTSGCDGWTTEKVVC